MEKIWTENSERKSMPSSILPLHSFTIVPCEKTSKLIDISSKSLNRTTLIKILPSYFLRYHIFNFSAHIIRSLLKRKCLINLYDIFSGAKMCRRHVDIDHNL